MMCSMVVSSLEIAHHSTEGQPDSAIKQSYAFWRGIERHGNYCQWSFWNWRCWLQVSLPELLPNEFQRKLNHPVIDLRRSELAEQGIRRSICVERAEVARRRKVGAVQD